MLEDYFSLQLKFAMHYAAKAGVPRSVAIERCTNLRRRLDLLGSVGAFRWAQFLARLQSMEHDHAAQRALWAEYYKARAATDLERSSGCFSYDPPDDAGVLRIHFVPPIGIDASPLAIENLKARMTDLRNLFSHVQHHGMMVKSVRGVSWLYNLHAYRRLFPSAYIASIQPARFALNLNGSSTWGQVLNWRGEVKSGVRDQLMRNLQHMNIETPWLVFPLQAMVAMSEVEVFYEFFT